MGIKILDVIPNLNTQTPYTWDPSSMNIPNGADIYVMMIGGGAGGQWRNNSISTQTAIAMAGEFIQKKFKNDGTTISYVIGFGGPGNQTSNGSRQGGSTSLTQGSTTITASGGLPTTGLSPSTNYQWGGQGGFLPGLNLQGGMSNSSSTLSDLFSTNLGGGNPLRNGYIPEYYFSGNYYHPTFDYFPDPVSGYYRSKPGGCMGSVGSNATYDMIFPATGGAGYGAGGGAANIAPNSGYAYGGAGACGVIVLFWD